MDLKCISRPSRLWKLQIMADINLVFLRPKTFGVKKHSDFMAILDGCRRLDDAFV